ncbi:MAG: putative multidrug export ATP-binding/permease protein [Nitrosomonadaceae bacterium]|nr:putative multidrug export ATP-binding/permease protein [Nitrosomonadaceae bacterium]
MFDKWKYRFGMIRKLTPFAYGVRRYFLLIGLISGISVATAMIIPTFYKMFIDQVIIGRDMAVFQFVIFGYLGLYVLDAVLAFVRNMSVNRLSNKSMFRIKHQILSHYFGLPFKDYETRSLGDLKMRIDDEAGRLTDFVGPQSLDFLKSNVTAICAAVLIFTIEWRLALFSMIIIPVTFYLDNKISKREKVVNDTYWMISEKQNSWLQNSFQGWKEVKALNLFRNQKKIFVRYLYHFAAYYARWIHYHALRGSVIPHIKDEFLMKFALYFFGGLMIMRGEITIGSLLVFAVYYTLLSKSIREVSRADADLQSNMPYYDRVMQELEIPPTLKLRGDLPVGGTNDISVKNVDFSYGADMPLIVKDLSFHVGQGERVALVGNSGSGKSTVLKLITGMLTPNSGQILYSNVDVRELNKRLLFKKIGYIMQENLMFNVTIRENLMLATPGADTARLDEACKKAGIDEFIHSLPKGYETVIGERGIKLSGGQRQRMVLARLFLRDVDVIIFDEATSALDQYSESIILDTICSIGRDITIIVVSHRESSIALCDRKISIS